MANGNASRMQVRTMMIPAIQKVRRDGHRLRVEKELDLFGSDILAAFKLWAR
jgi:hypothetical protein